VQKLFGLSSLQPGQHYSSSRLAYIPLEIVSVTAEEKGAINMLQTDKVRKITALCCCQCHRRLRWTRSASLPLRTESRLNRSCCYIHQQGWSLQLLVSFQLLSLCSPSHLSSPLPCSVPLCILPAQKSFWSTGSGQNHEIVFKM
jgi:hypothetical protein